MTEALSILPMLAGTTIKAARENFLDRISGNEISGTVYLLAGSLGMTESM